MREEERNEKGINMKGGSGIREEYKVNIQKGGAGSERDSVQNIRMEEGMNGI